MSRNKCFFSGSSITCFTFFYPFVTCLLTLTLIYSLPSYMESELKHSYRLAHDHSLQENEGNRENIGLDSHRNVMRLYLMSQYFISKFRISIFTLIITMRFSWNCVAVKLHFII
jgi:hypothetical protein